MLDCEDELLELADIVDLALFYEASKIAEKGSYDISLVDGSISTARDAELIREVRASSEYLVAMGTSRLRGEYRGSGTSPTSAGQAHRLPRHARVRQRA